MSATVARSDMHTEAFVGMQTQECLALISSVPTLHLLPIEVVRRATFNGMLHSASMHSGKDDQTIAADIYISQSYMSRLMSGMFAKWADVLVRFCAATNSIGPVQWIADRLGADVVVRQKFVSEADRLRAENESLRRQLRGAAA